MRHFKFYAETTFYLSIAEDLIKQKGVTYKFKEDDGRTNMGFKIGEYDIYVDDTIYTNQEVLDQLKDYEIIEIYKKDFDRMTDLNAEKSYSELCQKYDVIEKERDKFTERRLREQRNEILSNTLEYYKDDIEAKIKEEVNSRYTALFDRFHEEECSIHEVCLLYKKYIDAEIKKNISLLVNKVMKETTDNYNPYDYQNKKNTIIDIGKKMIAIAEFRENLGICYDEVNQDIKKFKNDLVDKFMETSGHSRGQRDYFFYMKKAGQLADLIESKLWQYYCLSLVNYEKETDKDGNKGIV